MIKYAGDHNTVIKINEANMQICIHLIQQKITQKELYSKKITVFYLQPV